MHIPKNTQLLCPRLRFEASYSLLRGAECDGFEFDEVQWVVNFGHLSLLRVLLDTQKLLTPLLR